MESTPDWSTSPIDRTQRSVFDDPDVTWKLSARPFAFGIQSEKENQPYAMIVIFPVWILILPLMLASCWMLFSRPRVKVPLEYHAPEVVG